MVCPVHKSPVHKSIGRKLSKTSVCYVLITCGEPTAEGDMQVEMTYEGDAALAAYLLHGAQIAIDEDTEESGIHSKILKIK